MKAAIEMVGHRETAKGSASQLRYHISSLVAPAEQLLAASKSHWSIENSLHWTLDVTLREDQCRVRKDHGLQNLATLRQITHSLLKNENTLKVVIQGQRLNVSPQGSESRVPSRIGSCSGATETARGHHWFGRCDP